MTLVVVVLLAIIEPIKWSIISFLRASQAQSGLLLTSFLKADQWSVQQCSLREVWILAGVQLFILSSICSRDLWIWSSFSPFEMIPTHYYRHAPPQVISAVGDYMRSMACRLGGPRALSRGLRLYPISQNPSKCDFFFFVSCFYVHEKWPTILWHHGSPLNLFCRWTHEDVAIWYTSWGSNCSCSAPTFTFSMIVSVRVRVRVKVKVKVKWCVPTNTNITPFKREPAPTHISLSS